MCVYNKRFLFDDGFEKKKKKVFRCYKQNRNWRMVWCNNRIDPILKIPTEVRTDRCTKRIIKRDKSIIVLTFDDRWLEISVCFTDVWSNWREKKKMTVHFLGSQSATEKIPMNGKTFRGKYVQMRIFDLEN